MARVATIGVYGWTADGFRTALREARISLVLDVRQRRGVRGSEYAWANARRLVGALEEAGFEYAHVPELAPTTELRELQYRADDRAGVGRRARARLTPEFRDRFEREILGGADLGSLVRRLPAALLCVERDPQACHRSLIAERLAATHGVDVVHLLPP